MSKIIVDQVQTQSGTAFTLPSADQVGGGVLQTNGSGVITASDVNVDANIATYLANNQKVWTKSYDLSVNNADGTTGLSFLWSDVLPTGKTHTDIATVRIQGTGVSGDTVGRLYFYGKGAGGNIETGYLGYGYFEYYDGTTVTDTNGHNSDGGYWYVPGYTNMSTTDYNYGSGLSFDMLWHFRKEGDYGNYQIHSTYMYQQNTSYSYPNFGQMAWDSYSTSAPPATATNGFCVKHSNAAGTFNRGMISLQVTLL
jgi:hypothetical protein